MKGKGGKEKMQFINYNLDYTTWTVWSAGLLVKDCITLSFNCKERGIFYVEVVVIYSARGYGHMVEQLHTYLDDRMLAKHMHYMTRVDNYRLEVVKPSLNELKGLDFKNIRQFIKAYNNRAYVRYR